MNIFNFFSKKKPVILPPAVFEKNSLIEFLQVTDSKSPLILQVGEDQAALVISSGKTSLFLVGEHSLSPEQFPHGILGILFFQLRKKAKRNWQSAYQPHDRLIHPTLAGKYIFSIDDIEKFSHYLLSRQIAPEDLGQLNDFFIDQWASFSIDEALKKERINANHIEYQRERVEFFIKETLNWHFSHYGLSLYTTYLITEVESPAEPVVPPEKDYYEPEEQQPAAPPEKPPVEEEEDEQVYHWIRNGVQEGPYSQTEIQQFIDQKLLKPTHLLWKLGMPRWEAAKDINIFVWD